MGRSMLRPYRGRKFSMGGAGRAQRQNDGGGGEELLNFAELFVAGIFTWYDQLGETENILDVAEICRLGERLLDDWIVDAEKLLQHAALLRFEAREGFISFGMDGD